MSRFATRNCFALFAAAVLAAACATENPPADTAAGPAAALPGAPAAAARSTPSARQEPRARAAPDRAAAPAAPVVLKGIPGQRSVYYDLDRDEIKPEFRPAIEAHARYLREHAGAKITIEGNGDERGSREYNLALGQRRAESVRKMMRLLGASDEQMEAVSFGEEKPKAQGHDEAAWAENRRSDFVYRRGD
jgi:peptidoglycan-associated lipoprotein